MKKIDGFINLKDYIDFESSNLTRSEFSRLKNGKIILKDNKKYFFKRCKDDWCYREVIAYEIANYLNIPSVYYQLALVPNDNDSYDLGCISLDYVKENHIYVTGLDVLYDYNNYYLRQWGYNEFSNNRLVNNLENIWQALEHRYRFEKNKEYIVAKLMYQLVTHVFLYDIFLTNPDRHYYNWEIVEFNNDANINLLFDNEDVFLDYSNSPKLAVNVEERKSNWYRNLEVFLNISSQDYIDKVYNMYSLLKPSIIVKLIERCEQRINAKIPNSTKERILTAYILHYSKLEDVINNCNCRKRKMIHGS